MCNLNYIDSKIQYICRTHEKVLQTVMGRTTPPTQPPTPFKEANEKSTISGWELVFW